MLLQAFYYIRRTEYRTGETDSSPEVLKKGKRDAARVQNKQKNEGQLETGRVTWQSQNRKLFISGRGWAGEKAPQGIWIHPLFTVVQWNALLLYRRYQIPLVNLYPRPPLSSHTYTNRAPNRGGFIKPYKLTVTLMNYFGWKPSHVMPCSRFVSASTKWRNRFERQSWTQMAGKQMSLVKVIPCFVL